MKTIGLIGGMSWESSQLYYREINSLVKEKLGGLHSSKCVLYSVDFHEIAELQKQGNWTELSARMAEAAHKLELSGADFLIICANTMHKCLAAIESAVNIPVLHIADPTAAAVQKVGIRKIGLLGTRFTMEQDFYKNRLMEKFNLSVAIPSHGDIEVIHRIIYEELVKGIILPSSREVFQAIIAKLHREGAEGIILGCTEITLLIKPGDVELPVFDTTQLHATAAVAFSLASQTILEIA